MVRKLQAVKSFLAWELVMVGLAVVVLVIAANPATAMTIIWPSTKVPAENSSAAYLTASRQSRSLSVTSIEDYDGPRVDCDSRPCIALSFDDGPNQQTTTAVLTTLEQRGVMASFFLVGSKIAGNETLVQRMAAYGFEVGNHTWDHQDMTKMPPEQIQSELLATQAAITNAGAPTPTLFRPPYGAISTEVVAKVGMQIALWNEDPDDWKQTDPNILAQTVIANARPGGVVDLHDIQNVTVAALPQIIDQLKAQNYQFVTVSQLLHSRARPGNEPFYGYSAGSYALHP